MSESLYTTAQAAALLGLTEGRIRQIARASGIGRKLGPRTRVFTPDEIEQLRTRPRPGRRWPPSAPT